MAYRLTEQDKDLILYYQEKGIKTGDIARRIGKTREAVAYFLKKRAMLDNMSDEEITIDKLQHEANRLMTLLDRAKKNNDDWKRKYYNIKNQKKDSETLALSRAKKTVSTYEKQVNILWLCINRMIDDIDHGFFDLDKFYEEAKNTLDKVWIGEGCK